MITEAICANTDLTPDDLASLDSYVDIDELREVLGAAGATLEFSIEGHDVQVTADGDVEIA